MRIKKKDLMKDLNDFSFALNDARTDMIRAMDRVVEVAGDLDRLRDILAGRIPNETEGSRK